MKLQPNDIYQTVLRDIGAFQCRNESYGIRNVEPTVQNEAMNRMVQDFLRKLEVQTESSTLAAFDSFDKANVKCKFWRDPTFKDTGEETLWGTFVHTCHRFFTDDLGSDCAFTWENILDNSRHGPGSSVGALSPSHYAKMYSSPLTATNFELIHKYKADISLWPELSNAEIIRQENFGSPMVVDGSRTTFVPKTIDTARMVCVEPTLNVYFQLGLGRILEKRLMRFFHIDLATQPDINRYLARVGSLMDASFGDGFATIDLKSASDSLSLGLVSRLMPAEEFALFVELRSGYTSIHGLGAGLEKVALNMMSTMGNGFTFPLQTALFAAACAASVSIDDSKERSDHPVRLEKAYGCGQMGTYSVFGDDLIIHPRHFSRLATLLNMMGCTLNEKKTFYSGDFRESCGHDYLRGYNVRPVFVRKLRSNTDLVVLLNNLLEWSCRNEIPLPKTVSLITHHLTEVHLVPFMDSESAGIRVPFGFLSDTRLLQCLGIDENGSLLYSRSEAVPEKVRFGDGVVHQRKGGRRLCYNPSGLLASYLKGEIRGGSISVRTVRVAYRAKQAVTPNWDYVPETFLEKMMTPSPRMGSNFVNWFRASFTDSTIERLYSLMRSQAISRKSRRTSRSSRSR